MAPCLHLGLWVYLLQLFCAAASGTEKGDDALTVLARMEVDEERHAVNKIRSHRGNWTSSHTKTAGVLANAGCDYSNGRWAPAPHRTYGYTGKSCKSMWHLENCQANKRPDVQYLHWRWIPSAPNCPLVPFNVYTFLQRFRGRSIAFVGDSLMSNFQDALQCLVSAVTPIRAVNIKIGGENHFGYRVPEYKMTVFKVPSGFIVNASNTQSGPTGAGGLWRVNLDQPLRQWATLLPYLSLLVFDMGAWYTSGNSLYNRAYYWRNVVQPKMSGLRAMQIGLTTVRNYLLRHPRFKGTPVFLTFSPVHWGPLYGLPSNSCLGAQYPIAAPIAERLINSLDQNMLVRALQLSVLRGTRLEPRWQLNLPPAPGAKAVDAAALARFRVLDITWLSLLRPDAHTQRYISQNGHARDCVHWCNPGLPNTWLDLLSTVLAS